MNGRKPKEKRRGDGELTGRKRKIKGRGVAERVKFLEGGG